MAEKDATARIDRWLWNVRIFKTRAGATEACKRNQISADGTAAKPSRLIRQGTVIQVKLGVMTKTVRVIALPNSRIGAKLLPDYLEDLTPEEEYERARDARQQERLNRVFDIPSVGRPTKLQRRQMLRFIKSTRSGELSGDE